jgi:hypothetical protein
MAALGGSAANVTTSRMETTAQIAFWTCGKLLGTQTASPSMMVDATTMRSPIIANPKSLASSQHQEVQNLASAAKLNSQDRIRQAF